MIAPVRLQLSRRPGFNLQRISIAYNGREAVDVARPGPWGNPFITHPNHAPGRTWGRDQAISVPSAEEAVECFRAMISIDDTAPGTRAYEMRHRLPELKGKNLACWCKPGAPCHADVLIEMANRPECEAIP